VVAEAVSSGTPGAANTAWMDCRPTVHFDHGVLHVLEAGSLKPSPSGGWGADWSGRNRTSVPSRGERFVLFSPNAGPGRSMRMASTTVIVDDAYAFTGSTHLWRRGLTFDSSYAMALFDGATTAGRSAAIATFRTTLMADRLGLPLVNDLPRDPADIVTAMQALVEREPDGSLPIGSGRLTRRSPLSMMLTKGRSPIRISGTRMARQRASISPAFFLGLAPSVYESVFNPVTSDRSQPAVRH